MSLFVFLHGIACTGRVWDPLIARLPDDWEALAPDLRFHGEKRAVSSSGDSKGRFGHSMEDYAQDLLETLKKTGASPVWLVGHSMGARVAVAASSLNDESVLGLILADHPLRASSEQAKSFRSRFRRFLEDIPVHFPSADLAERHLRAHCPDPSSPGLLLKSFGQSPEGGVELLFDKEAVLKTFDDLPAFPYGESLESLGSVGKPVLILRGSDSPFWNHRDWEESLLRFGGYDSFKFLELKGAGHALPFEMADRFLKETVSFVREWSDRSLPRNDGSSRR